MCNYVELIKIIFVTFYYFIYTFIIYFYIQAENNKNEVIISVTQIPVSFSMSIIEVILYNLMYLYKIKTGFIINIDKY